MTDGTTRATAFEVLKLGDIVHLYQDASGEMYARHPRMDKRRTSRNESWSAECLHDSAAWGQITVRLVGKYEAMFRVTAAHYHRGIYDAILSINPTFAALSCLTKSSGRDGGDPIIVELDY